jgi:hypothetical protein
MKKREEWYKERRKQGRHFDVSSFTVNSILDRAKEEMREESEGWDIAFEHLERRVAFLEKPADTHPKPEPAHTQPEEEAKIAVARMHSFFHDGHIEPVASPEPEPAPEEEALAEVERLEKACSDGRAELAKMSEVYEAGLRLGINWRDQRDEIQAKHDRLLLLASRVRTAHERDPRFMIHAAIRHLCAHVAESDPKEEGS